jgi:hypothetical protein
MSANNAKRSGDKFPMARTGRLRRISCDFGGQIEIAAKGIERPATG